jgi:hypothetical protein
LVARSTMNRRRQGGANAMVVVWIPPRPGRQRTDGLTQAIDVAIADLSARSYDEVNAQRGRGVRA